MNDFFEKDMTINIGCLFAENNQEKNYIMVAKCKRFFWRSYHYIYITSTLLLYFYIFLNKFDTLAEHLLFLYFVFLFPTVDHFQEALSLHNSVTIATHHFTIRTPGLFIMLKGRYNYQTGMTLKINGNKNLLGKKYSSFG